MTSPDEIRTFIGELKCTRGRIAQLAPAGAPGDSQLADALAELSEQLLVAEEELRVQQEQMADALRRADHLSRDYEELLWDAGIAALLTDLSGAVRMANPAADRLMRRPLLQAVPRPIASWFDVVDRPKIRAIITQARRGDEDFSARCTATLRRTDGSPVDVVVAAHRLHGRPELRWALDDRSSGRPLHAVPDVVPSRDVDLVDRISGFAAALAAAESPEDVARLVVAEAVAVVPGAAYAGVSMLRARGRVETVAATDDVVRTCDAAQWDLAEGPCLNAIIDGSTRVDDVRADGRWPRFAQRAAAMGVQSVLATQLATARGPIGALGIYAPTPYAFDADADAAARALSIQAAAALGRVTMEQNLRAGMATREMIGQAVGILVERKRITSRDAFDLLVRASQRTHVKLRDIAQVVVDTGMDPCDIEGRPSSRRVT